MIDVRQYSIKPLSRIYLILSILALVVYVSSVIFKQLAV